MKPISSGLLKRFGSFKAFIVYIICAVITVGTMIASIVDSIIAKNNAAENLIGHLFYCSLALIMLNIPLVMQSRFRFRIPAFIQILAEIFIVAHFVLGEVYRFYDTVILFDKTLHVIAGVTIATLGFSIVYGLSRTGSKDFRLSPFFIALFSLCFSLALLTLWEVFEYLMDSAFGLNMQRWEDGLSKVVVDGETYYKLNPLRGSGLIDTMTDIIVGSIGALAISIIGMIFVVKNPQSNKLYITKDVKYALKTIQLQGIDKKAEYEKEVAAVLIADKEDVKECCVDKIDNDNNTLVDKTDNNNNTEADKIDNNNNTEADKTDNDNNTEADKIDNDNNTLADKTDNDNNTEADKADNQE